MAGTALAAFLLPCQADRVTIHVDQPGITLSPTFYGLMTEEINHSYDGGIYAELIRNRAFKDGDRPVGWSMTNAVNAAAEMAIDRTTGPSEALRQSLKWTVTAAAEDARAGLANEGYWGIPVLPNTEYHASFYAMTSNDFNSSIIISIESLDGSVIYAKAEIAGIKTPWAKYDATLSTGGATPTTDARLVISVGHPGTIWLDLVSLFPPTFNHRTNGNRVDLMNLLGEMKPSFLRLPGGNYVEGNTIATRYPWQKTLGDLANRPGHPGTWGYRSSDGLGLLEYLEWCEDLKMEPVLAVWAGYALGGEHVEPGPALQPYIDEALEEIEYVTGGGDTVWGARRIKDGHPNPFPLTYVEVGNEDEFDRSSSYNGRFSQFYDAIKKKYPNLQAIATAPVRSRTPDVIDDHYYRSARQMENDHHYDTQSRKGPKVFVGEWASREGDPTPTMNAALGDAAWLIDLERNSDLVIMEAYAPLLVNVNAGAKQWATDLIGYDALHSFGSPSYYVQSMFAKNHGARLLPVETEAVHDKPPAIFTPGGAIGVGTWNTRAEFKDLKVSHGGKVLFESNFTNGLTGWRRSGGQWSTENGILSQVGAGENFRATTGDRKWTDYTYTLKARRTGGAEGFLVLFHVVDRDDFIWFNVGGWNNTRTALEKSENGAKMEIGVAATNIVETGRWYDVKVDVQGQSIRCYLDGQLVCETTDKAPVPADPIFANATIDPGSGDIYIHLANVSDRARNVTFDLKGASTVNGDGLCLELNGEPNDVNTALEPTKVSPRQIPLNGLAASFQHNTPAHSVSVIKLNAK
jgi:alpha-N-arabinofuranosidase